MDLRGEKDFKWFSKETTEVLDEYPLLLRDILKDEYGLTNKVLDGYIGM